MRYGLVLDPSSSFKDPLVLEGGANIRMGKHCVIGRKSWFSAHRKVHGAAFNPEIVIGDHVHIGNYAFITAVNHIKIGEGTLISDHFFCTDHTHGIDPSQDTPVTFHPIVSKGKTEIGKNCFIGIRVAVMPGITIGDKCVVGSNSVVTKDIPSLSMAVGNPAKVIKRYNLASKAWESVTN